MHDRLWYLSVPKSFFDDATSAGPFEFLTAISFAFEYVLTNLLFVPFMSGAAYNGDMATVTFGFSAQSDGARHMTLGLECIKRSEEHTSELQSLMRISYAVFCLKKKNKQYQQTHSSITLTSNNLHQPTIQT